MTRKEIVELLKHVHYLDWTFYVGEPDETPFLMVKFRDAAGRGWHGRKWILSQFMTKSEIVQTAMKAVLTAIEHEAREAFTYRDQAIFGPHYDVDRLAEICMRMEPDVRPSPAGKES